MLGGIIVWSHAADQYLGPYVWFTFTWLDLYNLHHTKSQDGGKNTHRSRQSQNEQVSAETGQKNIVVWTHLVSTSSLAIWKSASNKDAFTNLLWRAALQFFEAAGQQPAMAPENKYNVKLHILCRVTAIKLWKLYRKTFSSH